jgi:hypothetical protein
VLKSNNRENTTIEQSRQNSHYEVPYGSPLWFYTGFAINNRCLRFVERMLTFDQSRYVPLRPPDLFTPERRLLVIFTDKAVFFSLSLN